jgi:hypothetical protein
MQSGLVMTAWARVPDVWKVSLSVLGSVTHQGLSTRPLAENISAGKI